MVIHRIHHERPVLFLALSVSRSLFTHEIYSKLLIVAFSRLSTSTTREKVSGRVNKSDEICSVLCCKYRRYIEERIEVYIISILLYFTGTGSYLFQYAFTESETR